MTSKQNSGSCAAPADCDNDQPPPSEQTNYRTNLASEVPSLAPETGKQTETASSGGVQQPAPPPITPALDNGQRTRIGSSPEQQLAMSKTIGAGAKSILDRDLEQAAGYGAGSGNHCDGPAGDAAALIKPTLKRYLIMALFCLNSGNKAFQWLQVPSSTTKATILYDTDNYMINLCSIIFMIAFVLLSWPACYIIDAIGMRRAILLASFGTSIGSIVKCFSCHEEGIWYLIAGQMCVALSEQLIFSVPSRLASVWFPDHQVSMCVAMCIMGNQLGLTLGFLVPEWFLDNMETREEIGLGFYNMFLFTAGLSITISVICVIFFEEAPAHAPGKARLKQMQLESRLSIERGGDTFCQKVADLLRQVGRLFCNKQLMLLSTSYGIVVGIGYTIPTLLDQTLKPLWPDNDLIVGNAGFLIIIAGILATPIWGRAMDRWHAFKWINLIIATGTLLSLVLFAYVLVYMHSTVGVYVAAALFGLFNTGYIVSGLEYAVELTYPAPELLTSSIMNTMPMAHSIVYILIGSYIVDNHGALATSIFYVGLTMGALVFLLSTRETLKRQEAIGQMQEKPKRIPLGH